MQLKNPIQNAVVILGALVVLCVAIYIFAPVIVSDGLNPVPTATKSPSVSLIQFPSETPTDVPETSTMPASTVSPTNLPAPFATRTVLPTYIPSDKRLPDLTVTGISNPKCVPDYRDTRSGNIVRLTIYVRNIGRLATHSFGTSDVRISVILGETYYTLDEWASQFDGVIGNTDLEIVNLNPNQDVALNIVIELKGNRKFGIEAVANSGENIIPETNMLNNSLRKYFTIYCY